MRQRFASASTRPRARRGRPKPRLHHVPVLFWVRTCSCCVCCWNCAACWATGPCCSSLRALACAVDEGGRVSGSQKARMRASALGNRGARGSTERTVADSDRSRAAFMVRDTLTKVPRITNFVCSRAHVAATTTSPPRQRPSHQARSCLTAGATASSWRAARPPSGPHRPAGPESASRRCSAAWGTRCAPW